VTSEDARDAARYRWLRRRWFSLVSSGMSKVLSIDDTAKIGAVPWDGEALDREIDEALKAEADARAK